MLALRSAILPFVVTAIVLGNVGLVARTLDRPIADPELDHDIHRAHVSRSKGTVELVADIEQVEHALAELDERVEAALRSLDHPRHPTRHELDRARQRLEELRADQDAAIRRHDAYRARACPPVRISESCRTNAICRE
jgi:hypothetical protein